MHFYISAMYWQKEEGDILLVEVTEPNNEKERKFLLYNVSREAGV